MLLNGKKLDFSHPRVMAIINVTPDSFYAGSRAWDSAQIARNIESAIRDGAYIFDVGGYSSRPGADDIPAGEEIERIGRAMELIRETAPDTPVSIDTFRAEVARSIITRWGECIINDISAGELDPEMIGTAAELGVPYIAMHMRGTPKTMNGMTEYGDITDEVTAYLADKAARLQAKGVGQIILDPGFGFAKSVEQNYRLLSGLHRICGLGYPVVAGISRKSMIYRPLGISPAEALNGTTALHWEALRQGASIIRVHDTREAAETIRLFELFRNSSGDDPSAGDGVSAGWRTTILK